MALNYPGPYEVRIFYTTTISSVVLTHSQRLNIALVEPITPGTTFNLIGAVRADASPDNLQTVVDEWVALLRPLLSSSGSSIVLAELWKYTPGTFEAEFLSSYDINLAGTNAGATTLASQSVWTFRTAEGGILKINLMEGVVSQGAKTLYAAQGAASKALVDYVIADDKVWLGRDTSYPFSHIAQFPGQNEALFKKRLRS
jgi:hypothetical protein